MLSFFLIIHGIRRQKLRFFFPNKRVRVRRVEDIFEVTRGVCRLVCYLYFHLPVGHVLLGREVVGLVQALLVVTALLSLVHLLASLASLHSLLDAHSLLHALLHAALLHAALLHAALLYTLLVPYGVLLSLGRLGGA